MFSNTKTNHILGEGFVFKEVFKKNEAKIKKPALYWFAFVRCCSSGWLGHQVKSG